MVPLVASERIRATDYVMAVFALLGRAMQVHGRDVLCEARGVQLATANGAVIPETRLAILLRCSREIAVPIADMAFDTSSAYIVKLDVAAAPQAWDAIDGVLGKEGYGLKAGRERVCVGGLAGR